MKAIKNGVIFKDNVFIKGYVMVFNENIIDFISEVDFEKYSEDVKEVVDAKGNYVLPGFIDVHIHGYAGCDVMDNKEESIVTIKKAIAKNGVTSFLPTTLTASTNDLESVLDTVRKVK